MAQAGQIAALTQKPTDGIDPKHPCTGIAQITDARDGRIRLLMPDGVTPRKKIALCGFASSSRDMAPWDDPDWAIVGMNQLNRHVPRADVWYEIHKEWNTAVVPGTDHEGWLKQCGIPILMTDDTCEQRFPTWVRFPIERLIKRFGIDYFTSTVAFMVAWAIDYIDTEVEIEMRARKALLLTGLDGGVLGPENAWDLFQLTRTAYSGWSIGIYGVDLVVGEEYGWQKPCAEFWLGQLLARDITLYKPTTSALLKHRYRYGYDMEPQDIVKDSEIEQRRVELVNEMAKRENEILQLHGSIQELRRMQELRELRQRGASI